MGIRCLNKWLSWICPTEFQERQLDWSTLAGSTIGVDALGILYKAKHDQESVYVALIRLLLAWKRHAITPIFVFDGKSPQEKASTCSQRKKQRDRHDKDHEIAAVTVNASERNVAKQFIYASGCLCLNAEGEADTVLAYMAKRGDVDAVVSCDMDYLPRGTSRLLVPVKGDQWRDIHLSRVLEAAKITDTDLMDMCVLLGSDYCPSIPTLSYQSAYWLVRLRTDSSLGDILKHHGIRNTQLWEQARRILRGEGVTWEMMLSERQRQKHAEGSTGVETEAFTELWRADPHIPSVFTAADLHCLMSTSKVLSCRGETFDVCTGDEGVEDTGEGITESTVICG